MNCITLDAKASGALRARPSTKFDFHGIVFA
jgi:hypothetical protein